jgi:predicted phosphoribosyltransferase
VAVGPNGVSVLDRLLARVADEVVCVVAPEPFVSAGYWYGNFLATTDDGVGNLL